MPKVYLTAAQREAAQAQSGDDALRGSNAHDAGRVKTGGHCPAHRDDMPHIQPADEKSIAVDPG